MCAIKVKVPKTVEAVLESDEILKMIVEEEARKAVISYLAEFLSIDVILQKSGLTEKDEMELDEEIKRELWKKIKQEKGL